MRNYEVILFVVVCLFWPLCASLDRAIIRELPIRQVRRLIWVCALGAGTLVVFSVLCVLHVLDSGSVQIGTLTLVFSAYCGGFIVFIAAREWAKQTMAARQGNPGRT